MSCRKASQTHKYCVLSNKEIVSDKNKNKSKNKNKDKDKNKKQNIKATNGFFFSKKGSIGSLSELGGVRFNKNETVQQTGKSNRKL